MIDSHPTCFEGVVPTTAWAFDQYQRLREQLPQQPVGPKNVEWVSSLEPLIEKFDAFVFDAFGVLNCGPASIPGAVERLRSLQKSGKPVLVLSNAATASLPTLTSKYQRMGFSLAQHQVISSRSVLERHLTKEPKRGRWGVIAPAHSECHLLPAIDQMPIRSGVTETELNSCQGFIFLSSEGWNEDLQEALTASLNDKPRLMDVANPDLVAPRGDCLTLEPGFFAHRLREKTDADVCFYGKPYGLAFSAALQRLRGIPAHRILMVGDTLHTDILGANAAGMASLLVTNHGALKGMDANRCIQSSGIAPDFIAPSI